MKKLVVLTAGFSLLVAAAQAAAADNAKQKAETKAQNAQKQPAVPKVAELQVKLHRAMAVLIEAQSADNPDQEKIDKLTAQVRKLREEIAAAAPAGAPVGVGPGCPWGGPMRQAWAGGGRGYGRGPGWQRGGGYGRGAGYGWGAAVGLGPGYGRGMGGAGRFAAFVDRDGDGICDNFEAMQGQQ
jgi:hypothetical protein